MSTTKVELHCHIEGAAPVTLATQKAHQYGLDLSPFIDGDHYKWHDFSSFIAAYDAVANVFRCEEDYADLAQAYLKSLAQSGAIYAEIFVSPDHAISAGLTPNAYFDGLAAGMMKAEAEFGIISRMIVVGVRHLGADKVFEAAKIATQRPHPLITGFGMAGDERSGHPSDFKPAFDLAHEAGLGITVHAGELCGAKSVKDALDHLKPSRIGHGVRSIEDPELVKHLADHEIHLEICPGSNIALGVFPSFDAHPLRPLIDAGVPISLNSDDPPFFATSLQQEYDIAQHVFGLSPEHISKINSDAINAAFVDDATKQKLLDKLELSSI